MSKPIRTLFNHFTKIGQNPKRLSYTTMVTRPTWSVAENLLGNPDFFENVELLSTQMVEMFKEKIGALKELNNPILKAAKDLVLNNDTYKYGLIVLLIGRTALNNNKDIEIKHKKLAESAELLRRAHFFHKCLTRIPKSSKAPHDSHNLNKLAILIGDFLYTKVFIHLASLEDNRTFEAIFAAARDMAEVEVLLMSDNNLNLLPGKPSIGKPPNAISSATCHIRAPYQIDEILGNAKDEWFLRNLLRDGNLIGAACERAMILSNTNESISAQGYLFGQNVALAFAAQTQYERFVKKEFNYETLVSAPVLMHLHKHPEFYAQLMDIQNTDKGCDFNQVWEIVQKDDGLNDTLSLKRELQQRALEKLTHFNNSEEKNILINIVNDI